VIFDFLNHRTGRLDPSYAAIARKAGVCVRTVATALKRLRELGILNWVRRCAESWRAGRFVLEQDTNAYAVLPETQWRGYRPPAEPPVPAPGTWGAPPPMLDAVTLAALEADLVGKVQRWSPIPVTPWRVRWRASGGRSWRATREFYRSARGAEKPAPNLKHTEMVGRDRQPDGRKTLMNKKRPGEAVLRGGLASEEASARRYFFAAPVAATTLLCPDCASVGTRPAA
jgi:hypothetical protein